MTLSIGKSTGLFTTIVLLAAGSLFPGSARAQDAPRPIANNSGIFIDGTTLQIIEGTSKNDVSPLIVRLHARELRAGAIVFRVGDRLYLAEGGAAGQHALRALAERGTDRQAEVYDPATARRRGFVYDPDYANWRLKKTFDALVGAGETK